MVLLTCRYTCSVVIKRSLYWTLIDYCIISEGSLRSICKLEFWECRIELYCSVMVKDRYFIAYVSITLVSPMSNSSLLTCLFLNEKKYLSKNGPLHYFTVIPIITATFGDNII